MKYEILCRYEHWTRGGKVWTKWFKSDSEDSLGEAKSRLSSLKELSKVIDKKTKLKHEFKIEESN